MSDRTGEAKHSITPTRLKRVSDFIKSQCTKDRPEAWHVQQSGVPQSTFSSAKRGAKLGWGTAQRLAEYFGWGPDVLGFLDGTPPAGTYTSLEEGLEMGYPERGLILDRFRGIVDEEVLREVQRIELPNGQRLDAFGWAEVLMETAKRRKLLGKALAPTKVPPVDVGGQPTSRPPPKKK